MRYFFRTLFIGLFLTLFSLQASAGTLLLRNGRRVTGRFLEKGKNYVVVRTVKGPLKIRKSHIDRESWLSFAPEGETPRPPEPTLSAVELASDNWDQWYPGVAQYMDKVNGAMVMLTRAENELAGAAKGFEREEGMPSTIRKKVDQTFVTLREVNAPFKALTPPLDLQDFNDLFLDYQNTLVLSAKNFLLDDARGYMLSLHRARLSLLEAQEILQAVYDYHGAPQDKLEPVEAEIAAYQEVIPYEMMYRYKKDKKRRPYIIPALRGEDGQDAKQKEQ